MSDHSPGVSADPNATSLGAIRSRDGDGLDARNSRSASEPRCTAGRVATAGSSNNGWLALQHDLATLSTNSVHRSVLTRLISLAGDRSGRAMRVINEVIA